MTSPWSLLLTRSRLDGWYDSSYPNFNIVSHLLYRRNHGFICKKELSSTPFNFLFLLFFFLDERIGFPFNIFGWGNWCFLATSSFTSPFHPSFTCVYQYHLPFRRGSETYIFSGPKFLSSFISHGYPVPCTLVVHVDVQNSSSLLPCPCFTRWSRIRSTRYLN